jgi:hypothetical protein
MNDQLQELQKKSRELEKSRKELANNLMSVMSNGSSYFSKDWITEKILGLKSPMRKRKIKHILNE